MNRGQVQQLNALRSRWLKSVLTAAFVAAGCWAQALAASVEAAFDQANRFYEQGKYADAAAAYEKLVSAGHAEAALYFNLGNAWFKAGQTGRALVYYRLAERIAPRDPDIRANLKFVRGSVAGAAQVSVPWFCRWATHLTADEWSGASALGLWALFALLSARQLKPALAQRLFRYTMAASVVSLICSLGLWLRWSEDFLITPVVVVQKEAILRHGPLDESPSLQTLADGQELVVVDRKGEWIQATGASRGAGWLKKEQVRFLTPTP